MCLVSTYSLRLGSPAAWQAHCLSEQRGVCQAEKHGQREKASSAGQGWWRVRSSQSRPWRDQEWQFPTKGGSVVLLNHKVDGVIRLEF